MVTKGLFMISSTPTFSRDCALVQLRKTKLTQPYYSLNYNPFENSFVICTRPQNLDASTYELFKVG